eukprot:COSAG06_NODE_918_length_11551_cov_4.681802_9_plen_136_part_00
MSCLQVLPGVTKLDMRVLVDRAIVEAFVMVRKRALACLVLTLSCVRTKPAICQDRLGQNQRNAEKRCFCREVKLWVRQRFGRWIRACRGRRLSLCRARRAWSRVRRLGRWVAAGSRTTLARGDAQNMRLYSSGLS